MQHLGAVADDATALLFHTRQEAGYVHQGEQGDVEYVAHAYKPGNLVGCVHVKRAGHHHRLVGDDADHGARNAGKPDDHVAGKVGVHFEQFAAVHQTADHQLHVQWFGGVTRHQVDHARVCQLVDRHREVVWRVFGVVGG